MASLDVDAYSLNGVNTIEAEYWITNARATDANGVNTLTISSNRTGITEEDGIPVTELAPEIRNNIIGYETTVFGHARVLSGRQRQEEYRTDRSTSGTEIDAIRYHDSYRKYFEYHDKKNDRWERFSSSDQLVFYYLVRTDYSKMVQIDVSDWALNYEPTDMTDRRSVTYQVYVKSGNEDDTYQLVNSDTFWYNNTFTVSSVLVRQADADHYTIEDVVLDPLALGTVTDENGEYRFSLDLSKADTDNATVKIYVTPKSNVQPHTLTYVLNDGKITSAEGTYSLGSVYPHAPITTPTVEKDNCIFEGWYTDADFEHKWEGTTMPNENLTLYAKFTATETPKPEPEPEPTTTPAKYFVLLPNRGKPDDNHDQGEEFYLPSSKSNGGVDGLDQSTGYIGSLTQEGAEAVPNTGDSVTNIATGFSDEYLNIPTNLGFFTPGNWNEDGTYNGTADTSILGDNFNVNGIDIVWYTIKNQGIKDGKLDIHVDGYVVGVPVTVTYHPNYGTIPGMSADDHVVHATSGENHIVRENMFTAPNGYTFGGWYTDAACTEGKKVAVDSTETLRTDWHLYAKWVPNKFAVSYFVDNVQDGETEEHAVGTDVTVKATPTKTGYTFSGWTPAADVANIIKVADGKFTMPAQNVLFNGTFTINQYRVIYKVDGVETKSTKHAFNTSVKIEAEPTKEGYTFSGWSSKDVTLGGTDFTMPAKDVVIEGTFTAREYNVTYKVDGVETKSTKHAFNTSVKIEAEPTKEGYTFSGWSSKDVTLGGTDFTMPAKDVTIEGTFAINRYTVTYKVDGKEVGTDVYNFNSDVAIRPVPTKEGYTFSGWKIGNADAENFKMPAHDVVIEGTYAKNSSGSSGGSSGRSGGSHRKPTVTIQDEVPTGLNGDDHYAYIVGYPDKTVRPQNGITRAEVATIFFRLLTDETRNANSTKSNSYSDVAAGAWYNHAVSTLSAMGIVKGDSDGKFNPNASITRAEFAAIAARFDDKANTSAASFSDIANHWAKDEISAAANNGWITGYTDGTFRPNNRITRAEAMALVNRVLKRLPETDEDLHADMIKWSDNSDASQWYYLDVLEATNSHYYQTKENQFEKWTELRDTRDWTELEK